MVGEPYIPETITVHLGAPDDSSAPNVTVSFPDYIKNVASSELYPSWPENALRANIYAQVSYALNRYYTEWYRSRGYDFDITNDTRYDQYYVHGRDIFRTVSDIADSLFDDYIRRQGTIEPLFAAYCDGDRTMCDGLKQWETVTLANQGMIPYDILTYYYGNDIDIVENAPVRPGISSFPDQNLGIGNTGESVTALQQQLNRISQNYPAIPKIPTVNGIYDGTTEDAVRTFQQIFNLPQTGIVDKATWYRISYIFVSVKCLAELDSEGLRLEGTPLSLQQTLSQGDSGDNVRGLQYFLSVIGAYYDAVPAVDITGEYDTQTTEAVKAFQQIYGLPVTGITDDATFEDIFRAYRGIVESVPVNVQGDVPVLYPGTQLREGVSNEYVRVLQQYLTYIHRYYPQIPEVSDTGYFGPITRNAVMIFQRLYGQPATGVVGTATWNEIANEYSKLRFGYVKAPGQYPGYVIQ